MILQHINGIDVPLSVQSLRSISTIKQLIWKNVRDKVPDAKLASTYNPMVLEDYIDEIQLMKKTNVSYNVTNSGLPSFTGPATY